MTGWRRDFFELISEDLWKEYFNLMSTLTFKGSKIVGLMRKKVLSWWHKKSLTQGGYYLGKQKSTPVDQRGYKTKDLKVYSTDFFKFLNPL